LCIPYIINYNQVPAKYFLRVLTKNRIYSLTNLKYWEITSVGKILVVD
jgi:hypothetical protein